MTDPQSFPNDFLWGVATAAHQVEGNNINSDTWLLEQLPGTIFAEPSGDAVDHYHRYREDIALIASLGSTPTASPWNGRGSSLLRDSSRQPHSTTTAASWKRATSTA